MRFDPVFLPDPLDGRASQTFLRHYNQCPRSGYLYAAFKGRQRTRAMERGKVLHAILERATNACVKEREPFIPPEIVKAIADEVLADPEFAVPVEEHDAIREMSYRWAAETVVDPDAVVAVERLFLLDLAGFEVRCKIDHAELLDGGEAVLIRDYKSSRGAPSQEDIGRHLDGRWVPKQFQLILYALCVHDGVPARVETCPVCEGEREREIPNPGGPRDGEVCDHCEGRGVIETREERVAPKAARFDLEYVFPAIENKTTGKMLRRELTITGLELGEYRASLVGLLERLRHSEESGDWPAVVSDAACAQCPAPQCCPIPSELRGYRGTITNVEQAAEVAEFHDQITRQMAELRRAVKAFCEEHEISLRFGGRVWEFVARASTRMDRDGLAVAVQRLQEHGEPFDLMDFQKVSTGTDFRARDLTADELAAYTEGSDD